MKKILLLFVLVMFVGCSGYTPIYGQKNNSFYIEEIEYERNNNLSFEIVKKLKPYSLNPDLKKNNVILNIKIFEREDIISRNAQGDPLIFNLNIEAIIDFKTNKDFQVIINESFSFNNQSNKFELNQYKKNIKKNIASKIADRIILEIKKLNDS